MARRRNDPLDELIDRGVARIQELVRQGQADLARWARHQEEMQRAHARWQAKQTSWAKHYEEAIRANETRRERLRQDKVLRHQARRKVHAETRAARRAERSRSRLIFLLPLFFLIIVWSGGADLGPFALIVAALVAALGVHWVTSRREDASASKEVESERVVDAVPVPTPAPKTPEALTRVDALCQSLLDAFREGPETLREVLHRPEQTITAVEDACHELYRREQALRKIATPEDDERLRYERLELTRKLDQAPDQVVRERLGAAIQSLDRQLEGRKALATSADRLEAERTRLRYTLEALQTEVLRVRSADVGGIGVVGIEQELARVGEELTAVADSIDAVSRGIDELPSPASEPIR